MNQNSKTFLDVSISDLFLANKSFKPYVENLRGGLYIFIIKFSINVRHESKDAMYYLE